jgi:hypothetical protein
VGLGSNPGPFSYGGTMNKICLNHTGGKLYIRKFRSGPVKLRWYNNNYTYAMQIVGEHYNFYVFWWKGISTNLGQYEGWVDL